MQASSRIVTAFGDQEMWVEWGGYFQMHYIVLYSNQQKNEASMANASIERI